MAFSSEGKTFASADDAREVRNVLAKLDIPDGQNGHRRVLAVVAYISEMHKA